MSDFCNIKFKKITPEEIYPFIRKLKETGREYLEKIAEEEFGFLPYFRDSFCSDFPEKMTDVSLEDRAKAREWAVKVFTFRFFYDPETCLFGAFGLSELFKNVFDCSVDFQNCSDQDYDRKEWEGVDLFTNIYDKWQKVDEKELLKDVSEEDLEDFDADRDRKTRAYAEIWEKFEKYFYDKDEVFVSLFTSSDHDIYRFVNKCHEKAYAWTNQ